MLQLDTNNNMTNVQMHRVIALYRRSSECLMLGKKHAAESLIGVAMLITALSSPSFAAPQVDDDFARQLLSDSWVSAASALGVLEPGLSQPNGVAAVSSVLDFIGDRLGDAASQLAAGADAVQLHYGSGHPYESIAYPLLLAISSDLQAAASWMVAHEYGLAATSLQQVASRIDVGGMEPLTGPSGGPLSNRLRDMAELLEILSADVSGFVALFDLHDSISHLPRAQLESSFAAIDEVAALDYQELLFAHFGRRNVSSLDVARLKSLPERLENDTSLQSTISALHQSSADYLRTFIAAGCLFQMHAAGGEFARIGDAMVESVVARLPAANGDCPSECTYDNDCGPCEAFDLTFSAVGHTPKRSKQLQRILVAAMALAEVQGYAGTGSALSTTLTLVTFQDLPQLATAVVELLDTIGWLNCVLYVRIKWGCCFVNYCRDWFPGGLRLYETIERTLCQSRESGWVRALPAMNEMEEDVFWKGKPPLKRARDMASIVASRVRTYCLNDRNCD